MSQPGPKNKNHLAAAIERKPVLRCAAHGCGASLSTPNEKQLVEWANVAGWSAELVQGVFWAFCSTHTKARAVPPPLPGPNVKCADAVPDKYSLEWAAMSEAMGSTS